jgi:hypothetical protein
VGSDVAIAGAAAELVHSVAQEATEGIHIMPTYMLTWNPRQQRPADLDEGAARIARGKLYHDGWSVGNRRRLAPGSRVFLIRQGKPPKGVVASGFSVSEPEPSHNPKWHSNYIKIDFTMVLRGEGEDVLPLEDLQADPVLKEVNWGSRRGGVEFTDDQAARLEVLWRGFLKFAGKPELSRSAR